MSRPPEYVRSTMARLSQAERAAEYRRHAEACERATLARIEPIDRPGFLSLTTDWQPRNPKHILPYINDHRDKPLLETRHRGCETQARLTRYGAHIQRLMEQQS